MKKTIATALFTVAFSSHAFLGLFGDTKSTIINTSSKASPATTFTMAYKKATDSDWYQASNCEDGLSKFSTVDNAIMSYNSSIEFAARNKGLNCPLAGVKTKDVAFIGYTPVHLCVAKGSDVDFGQTKNHTLGMASMYATKEHENRMNEAGANVTIVPYSGSKTVLTALRAGDIDIGWIGSGLAMKHADKIDCKYSTDPAVANYIGKKLPGLTVPDFRITFVLYGNGSKPTLDKAAFDKFLKSKNITEVPVSDESVKGVITYVDQMFNAWSNKSK